MTLARDLSLALDPALMMARCGLEPDAWQADVMRSTAPRTTTWWPLRRVSGWATTGNIARRSFASQRPHMDGAEGELAPRRNRPELVSETMRATRAALDWWEVLAVRGIDDPGREIDMPLPEHGGEQDDRR